MPVIQAKSAGFCYGVRRAVELAEKTARETGGCVMLGSLIHNANVVARLEQLGARQVDSTDEVHPGDTVIIRSHGETRQVLERLEAMGARCVNATCPNVLHIQHIVSRAGQAGRMPLVIGEPHHPEVMGAASWWDGTLVFPGPEELERWLLEDPARRDLPLTAVAQTTCVRSIWESSKKILKKLCTNAELFDTICDATHRRQSEAAEIASRVDVMVVVGDRKSANTKHLTEICRELCPRVYQIEGAEELTPDLFIGCSLAGLTAGASTPAGIIKEVYTTMSEEIKNMESTEESFEELLEKLDISFYDFNIILGNLLDNSIEAAEQTEEKYIKIYITYRKHKLNIEIHNTTNNKVDMNNVKTTKKDTVNHGYGIKNIKEILNKYESVYDAEQDGNMFKTKMCIFM